MANDWKQFVKRIPIKAPAKSIYEAWATQQGLETWFLRLAQFTKADGTVRQKNSNVEPADRYIWFWYGYNDDTKEENSILEANGWDRLKFQFSGECIVTVSIKQDGGETICELIQEMPQEDEDQRQYYFIECGEGWTFYLANLKSVLEGGLDLRNRNEKLYKVINS